jgi:hypothetical protein
VISPKRLRSRDQEKKNDMGTPIHTRSKARTTIGIDFDEFTESANLGGTNCLGGM